MIKLIGLKRAIVLGCVLVLNLVLAGIYFAGLSPVRQEADMQLAVATAQIGDLNMKIANIKQEMLYLEESLPKYHDLEQKGFFRQQDRFMIGRTMEDLRIKAGIASFSFTIADTEVIPNAAADAMGHQLVNSRITVEDIVTPFDSNVYILMQEMSYVFPEYARIESMEVTRLVDVSEAALKDISEGKAVKFVDATVSFDWMTLVPKNGGKPGEVNAADGFRGQ